MQSLYTLVYLAEQRALCVKASFGPCLDEPKVNFSHYPILYHLSPLDSEIYAVGSSLVRRSLGGYHYADQSLPQHIIFECVDGNRTVSILETSEPIPCPKVRNGIQTRYESGRWEKYSKIHGWVAV